MKTISATNGPRLQRLVGLALAVYWIALFVGTHIPLPEFEELPKSSDKAMHFAAYAGLSFLIGLWISARRALTVRIYVLVFAATVVYAVLDELLQIPVGRSCDVLDILADWAGSLIGLGILAAGRLALDRYARPVAQPAENQAD